MKKCGEERVSFFFFLSDGQGAVACYFWPSDTEKKEKRNPLWPWPVAGALALGHTVTRDWANSHKDKDLFLECVHITEKEKRKSYGASLRAPDFSFLGYSLNVHTMTRRKSFYYFYFYIICIRLTTA